MPRKDSHTNISHREDSNVQQLFEELLKQNNLSSSDWVRKKKREWLMEQGLDGETAETLISELEDDIRDIEDEICEKERELEDLRQRKKKIQSLSGEVDLSSGDGSSGEGGNQGDGNGRIGIKTQGGDS
jgi:predicted  nucleic acid-binding Zn-ribbon protein